MKTMNYKRMLSALAVTAMIAMTMTACGGKKGSGDDTGTSGADGSSLPVDATMTDIAYAESEPQYESAVTTESSETESSTESVTEDSSSGTDGDADSNSEGENGGSDGGNAGGGGDYDAGASPDLNVRTVLSDLAWFRVDSKDGIEQYSLRDTKKFDELTDDKHLNHYGNFLEIGGETYSGYLTELFGFSGQAYWLRGEGGHKCFIEKDDNNDITAIAFTDMHDDYTMRFAEIIKYNDSETADALGDFELTLESTDGMDGKVEPVILTSEDGEAEVYVYNDGSYSMALEVVSGAGKDGADALKTVMIYNNHRNK